MKLEINDKGETIYLSYSLFEIEISSLLFSLYGGSTEPLYEQKDRWEYIQALKKMAQDELKIDKNALETDLKEYMGGAELLRTENKDYSKDFPDHFVEQIHRED